MTQHLAGDRRLAPPPHLTPRPDPPASSRPSSSPPGSGGGGGKRRPDKAGTAARTAVLLGRLASSSAAAMASTYRVPPRTCGATATITTIGGGGSGPSLGGSGAAASAAVAAPSGTAILATSSASAAPTPSLPKPEKQREPLSDRKGPIDHLKPRPLLISVMRVTVLQASTILATYVTDQLEYESSNEDLVLSNKLTAAEADDLNAEWEEREWKLRWGSYGKKCWVAFGKLQATTLIMRGYEALAARLVDEKTLDRLTKDTFKSAIRKADRLVGKGGDGSDGRREVQRQMVTTGLWANAIAFLSDGTLQIGILAYGYYVYWSHRRDRGRRQMGKLRDDDADRDGEEGAAAAEEASCPAPSSSSDLTLSDNGGIALSFLFKSTQIAVSRTLAYIAASYGGSYGSMLYPGWGTLMGTSLGDSMVAALLDSS